MVLWFSDIQYEEPSPASKVRDDRSNGNRQIALDPAPGSRELEVWLDKADAVIDLAGVYKM